MFSDRPVLPSYLSHKTDTIYWQLEHLVVDCPSEEKLCHHCQSPDHLASECPNPVLRECYVCGSTEHIRNACPLRPPPVPRPPLSAGGGRGGQSRSKKVKRCRICGEDDHLFRECDQYDPELAAAKKACHNCGQLGHIMSQVRSSNAPQRWGEYGRECVEMQECESVWECGGG